MLSFQPWSLELWFYYWEVILLSSFVRRDELIFLRFRGTEIVKTIYFPTICLISNFGKILAVMQKIWLCVLIYNSFICLLGLLLSWERIHYFLCLQDVLHVLRWEVVSHCLQGDTTSNRCESNGAVYINCSCLFPSYDWNLFSSLLLFDNIASSVGSSRAVWGVCTGMEAASRGKRDFWNSKTKNTVGVRETGERMLCTCAIYHFFRLFWLFPSVSASAFFYIEPVNTKDSVTCLC